MIKKWLRNKNGKKVGLVLAISSGKVGYSACNENFDTFDPILAEKLAVDRAIRFSYEEQMKHIPSQFRNDLDKMLGRSVRYFKYDTNQKDIDSWDIYEQNLREQVNKKIASVIQDDYFTAELKSFRDEETQDKLDAIITLLQKIVDINEKAAKRMGF